MKRILALTALALLLPGAAPAGGEESGGRVAAVDERNARPVRYGELLTAGAAPLTVVDGRNAKIELAPHSVGEFREDDGFHLLRGAACLESQDESAARTSGAAIAYAGRVIVSYDHKERSTSAFVLEGQARVSSGSDASRSLRLDRFRGATMVVGDVIPQLTRQLDVSSLEAWLKGYAWPEAARRAWLDSVPSGRLAVKPKVPAHLEEVRLESYFSAIDNDDDVQAPDYYDRKFADPDKVVAEQNSVKEKGAGIKPEEAALIALPSTKIDLGFDLGPQVLTLRQKQAEPVLAAPAEAAHRAARAPASVKPARPRAKATPSAERDDPEVSAVLNRLRSLRGAEPGGAPRVEYETEKRQPASVGFGAPFVPDTVYDYSQNF